MNRSNIIIVHCFSILNETIITVHNVLCGILTMHYVILYYSYLWFHESCQEQTQNMHCTNIINFADIKAVWLLRLPKKQLVLRSANEQKLTAYIHT